MRYIILVLNTSIIDQDLPAPPPDDVPGAPTPPVVCAGGGEGGDGGDDGPLCPGPLPGAVVDKETR